MSFPDVGLAGGVFPRCWSEAASGMRIAKHPWRARKAKVYEQQQPNLSLLIWCSLRIFRRQDRPLTQAWERPLANPSASRALPVLAPQCNAGPAEAFLRPQHGPWQRMGRGGEESPQSVRRTAEGTDSRCPESTSEAVTQGAEQLENTE